MISQDNGQGVHDYSRIMGRESMISKENGQGVHNGRGCTIS